MLLELFTFQVGFSLNIPMYLVLFIRNEYFQLFYYLNLFALK